MCLYAITSYFQPRHEQIFKPSSTCLQIPTWVPTTYTFSREQVRQKEREGEKIAPLRYSQLPTTICLSHSYRRHPLHTLGARLRADHSCDNVNIPPLPSLPSPVLPLGSIWHQSTWGIITRFERRLFIPPSNTSPLRHRSFSSQPAASCDSTGASTIS